MRILVLEYSSDDDDDDDDDHSVCDDDAGDGQLPWESNLQTRCGPGADQMETNQGWAQPGPTPCLVSAWSALGLHLVHLVCIHCLVFICHAHAVNMHCTCSKRVFMNPIRTM